MQGKCHSCRNWSATMGFTDPDLGEKRFCLSMRGDQAATYVPRDGGCAQFSAGPPSDQHLKAGAPKLEAAE